MAGPVVLRGAKIVMPCAVVVGGGGTGDFPPRPPEGRGGGVLGTAMKAGMGAKASRIVG